MNKVIRISNKTVACVGAKFSITVVFGYSLLIMLYVIIRSSFTIYNIMPDEERGDILLVNGFSVAYSVAIFSFLIALLSSIWGAITGMVLKKSLQYFNPNFTNAKAMVISCITALATLLIIYLLLCDLLNDWMTFNYIETLSFWFLFPAIIYVGVCTVGGRELNRIYKTFENEKNTHHQWPPR